MNKIISWKGFKCVLAAMLILIVQAVWAETPIETKAFNDALEMWSFMKENAVGIPGVGFRQFPGKEVENESYTYSRLADCKYFTFINKEGITLEVILVTIHLDWGGNGGKISSKSKDNRSYYIHSELGEFIHPFSNIHDDELNNRFKYWFHFTKTYGFENKEQKEVIKQYTKDYNDRYKACSQFFFFCKYVIGAIGDSCTFSYQINEPPQEDYIVVKELRDEKIVMLYIPYKEYTRVFVVVPYTRPDPNAWERVEWSPRKYVEEHPELFLSKELGYGDEDISRYESWHSIKDNLRVNIEPNFEIDYVP